MLKLLFTLLTAQTVYGIKCYVTDTKNPLELGTVTECKNEYKSCMAISVIYNISPEIYFIRTCSEVQNDSSSGVLEEIERSVCRTMSLQLPSVTYCAAQVCFIDECNQVGSLQPKTIGNYGGQPEELEPAPYPIAASFSGFVGFCYVLLLLVIANALK